jgi:double-stranded uracil-DNA glycosylase
MFPWLLGKGHTLHPDLPDYLRPGLKLVFVGINPGERSARVGHYYAGRGNQFWNFLSESGLTPVHLKPEEDHRVLEFGFGLTDLVKRWSNSIRDLNNNDFQQGVPTLKGKLLRASPEAIAFNGKTGFEKFQGRKAELAAQRIRLGNSRIYVLPSTSGRNGSLSRSQKLRYFRQLKRWLEQPAPGLASPTAGSF